MNEYREMRQSSEQILAELVKKQQKTLTCTRIIAVILVIALLAFTAAGIALLPTVRQAEKTLETAKELLERSNAVVQENAQPLSDALEKLSSVDFSKLNDLDTEKLISVIDSLNDAVQPFLDMMSAFGIAGKD